MDERYVGAREIGGAHVLRLRAILDDRGIDDAPVVTVGAQQLTAPAKIVRVAVGGGIPSARLSMNENRSNFSIRTSSCRRPVGEERDAFADPCVAQATAQRRPSYAVDNRGDERVAEIIHALVADAREVVGR